MADGVPMRESFIGVTPFLITDAIRVAALITLPGITLLLPHLLAR
jgi:TRAP-type C4-dicarboxylate transport system permease large subunit